MNGFSHFIFLAGLSLQVMVLLPTTVLTLIGGIGILYTVAKVEPRRWRQAVAAAVLPLVVPASILLCGVLLANDPDLDLEAPEWRVWLVQGLLLVHLPLTAVLMKLLWRIRWFTLFASLAVFGYSCGAVISSTMSVTGDWL